MLLSSLLAAQLALAAGCADAPAPVAPDGPAGGSDAPAATPSISDGAHGGADGFYFLPPLVEAPAFDGTFDATRSPTVEICTLTEAGCGDVIATFTMDTGPGSETVRVDTVAEHYVANWHTDAFELVEGQLYRIRVSLEGREAGHADVVAVTSGKELKNAETGEQIALKDGRTLPIKFRIEEELVLAFTVPAVTPDRVPDSIYDAENVITDSPLMSGAFLRNIVLVVFREGASRSERQEAVELVGGEVVGGKRVMGDDGFYFVRIEDDGTAGPLFEAIETLEALPQVALASAEHLAPSFDLYLRPTDGSGFDDWSLSARDASGDNWALERISAPLGWGCDFGNVGTPIAVVDRDFHAISELTDNLDSSLGLGAFSGGNDHGTLVASVLAARGNDSTKITGTMWRAGLRLLDYGVDPAGNITRDAQGRPQARLTELLDRVQDAARGGADVINMSVGADTSNFVNPGPSAPKGDSTKARDIAAAFHRTVADLDDDGIRPLIVLGAGNGGRGVLRGVGIDAFWSAFPIVRDSFPDRILVVAATEQNGEDDAMAGFSNDNSGQGQPDLVEIAAPGVDVTTLIDGEQVVSRRGTSVAAPHVSGVAGLLASFDPRLSAAQLKDKVIDGAEQGGRSVRGGDGDIPVLNAHESLKAAAEETDAPLCGNRLWIDDGQIATQRGDGGPVENLAPVDGEIGALMEALHGGKVLWYGTRSGDRVLRWEPEGETSSWTSAGVAGLPSNLSELRSGTDASMRGRSHGRDTLVLTDVSQTAGSLWWFEGTGPVEAPLARFTTSSSDEVASITVRDLPFEHEVVCIERVTGGTCTSSVLATRTWFFRLSYPQHDRTIVETVSPVYFTHTDSTAWQTCSFDADRECREITLEQKHAGTLVYEVDLETGGVTKWTPSPRWSSGWASRSPGPSR